jgi:hypothetical protein
MDEAQYLALPAVQRKALQKEWQAKGLYRGPIDGLSGDGMRKAFATVQAAQGNEAQTRLRGEEIELERLRLQEKGKERETGAKAAETEESKRVAREKSADPWMDTFVPFATGAGVGGVYGELTNRGLNKFEEGNARALREISDELGPTRNLTGSQLNRSRAKGAAVAAERFAPTSAFKKGLSGAGRLASYGIPAAVVANEYRNYQNRANDPNLTETERKANQQIANGLLGVTTGIGVEGGRRFFFPSREAGVGKAEMRIQAAREFANRMDADTVAKGPTKAALAAQAETVGAKVTSRMTKAQIEAAIAGVKQIGSKLPAIAGPLAAAGLAYSMTPGSAEAADGSTESNNSQAATNAGVAGTAAAGYGLLPQVVRRAAGAGMSMLAPFAAADAYDPTDAELNRDRIDVASRLPKWAQVGALEDAGRATQVPEPSPTRSVLSGHTARAAGPLASASALQIPEGIPLPREDGSSPYAEAQPARAASGDQRFDTALQDWLRVIQEHNSSLGGAQ